MLDKNLIYHGDCLEIMKEIPNQSIDLLITDPPYKIEAGGGEGGLRSGIFYRNQGGRQLFDYVTADKYMPEFQRILKPSAHLYVFSNDKNISDILNNARLNNFVLMNIITLDKGNKVAFGWYMKQTEFVLLFRNKIGKAKQINDMSMSNLIKVNFPKGKKRNHPSEKSVSLIETFINQSSKINDLVLDPFVGSGTLAIACLNLDRNFIGIEKEMKYVQIANQRIQNWYRGYREG